MTDPPATVRTVCPHCRALLAVAAGFVGRPVACGRCRQVFVAEGMQPNPPAPFPEREGGASGWQSPARTSGPDDSKAQPNPPAPFPEREGGASATLPPPESEARPRTSAPLAPPSLSGKGVGGLGRTHSPREDDSDEFVSPRRRRTDGSATASLVLGIVSLVFFCVFPVSLTTGALGAWLGVAGLKSRSRPLAVTGLTLSAVGVVFGLGFAVLFLAGVVKAVNDQPRLGPARNNPTFHGR